MEHLIRRCYIKKNIMHFGGGVIVDVHNKSQAKMAEDAGAKAVNVTDNISKTMVDMEVIQRISNAVNVNKILVMAKVRIGNFGEARELEASRLVNWIDESEYLEPLDRHNYIDKRNYNVPFVCGCQNLGEALNRLEEGAALIRINGFSNVYETEKKVKGVMNALRVLKILRDDEVFAFARNLNASYPLVAQIKKLNEFPVPLLAGGGIATPEDAVRMMRLGCDGVFVWNDVFDLTKKGSDKSKRLRDIVQAVADFDNSNANRGKA